MIYLLPSIKRYVAYQVVKAVIYSLFSNATDTFITAVSALLGSSSAVWAGYNAMKQRHVNNFTAVTTSAIQLVSALQAEIVRLNAENKTQRDDLDKIRDENNDLRERIEVLESGGTRHA